MDVCPYCGKPLEEEPDAPEMETTLDRYLTDGQDPNVVERTFERIRQLLTAGEQMEYIAIQHKPVMNVTPLCVVLTTRRIILYKPGLLGSADFQDYVWRDLVRAHIKEKMVGATLTLEMADGEARQVDYLPKEQARRAYAIAQQMEERVAEMRRQHELEDKRAASGGVVVQAANSPSAAAPSDLRERLQQLKELHENDLITEDEYESKKAEILSSL